MSHCRKHLRDGHTTAHNYASRALLEFGKTVTAKRRIYLDTKYWIFCRDAMRGRPKRPQHQKIWDMLCLLVSRGTTVCPLSNAAALEFLKQDTPEPRNAMGPVVDRLSGGVAIGSLDELSFIELQSVFSGMMSTQSPSAPLLHRVWSPIGMAFHGTPGMPRRASRVETVVRKSLFDLLGGLTFAEALSAPAVNALEPRDGVSFYEMLNASSSAHHHEMTDFKTVFLSEIFGALDVMEDEIADVMLDSFEAAGGRLVEPLDPEQSRDIIQKMKRLLYEAFRQEKLPTENIPGVLVHAGIHASLRHRGQRYKQGDFWDWHHAHAALPYCDAFFTEKSLGSLVSTKPLELRKTFGCQVLWKDDKVVAYLETLV